MTDLSVSRPAEADLATAGRRLSGGWVVAAAGYQPFIAVVANDGQGSFREICETQNEAAAFVARANGRPLLATSRLLRAVSSALQGDGAAAEAGFHDWLSHGSECEDGLIVADPGEPPFPAFVGYPLFKVSPGPGDPSDGEARVTALRAMCTAFEGAPGNDAARFCIIEAARKALQHSEQLDAEFSAPSSAASAQLSVDHFATRGTTPAEILVPLLRSGQAFVTIGLARDAETTVLRLRSQNEKAALVAEAKSHPELAASGLIRAISLAFQGEFYDAGCAISDWIETGDDGWRTDPLIGELSSSLGSLQLDYPAYWVSADAGERERAAERSAAALRLLHAYDNCTGNDGAKWQIVEALALGLSKHFGSCGEYRQAMDAVVLALGYAPKSIHLRAAEFALDLKLAGAEVPGRFNKFIGPDDGSLLDRICSEPFKRFDISPGGEVLVCCGHWVPTPIGNLLTDDVGDILNSEAALKLRASMLDGSYKYCNHLECSAMIQEILPRKERVVDPVLRAAVDTGRLEVDRVSNILFAFDQSCNLSCPSCRETRIVEKASLNEAKTAAIEQKLTPLLHGLQVLNINPAGEVFSSKPSRKLLQMVSRETCPDLKIDIISNGMLFSEKEWAKFPNLEGMVRTVRISTDGATKATFESLRRLAVWEVFVQNMTFLGDLRRRNEIPQLKFSFTYQIENFREMADFVDFCRGFNCDFVIFERLQNLGAYSWEEFRDRAVHLNQHPLHGKFLEMVSRPIFSSRDVWHDFEWEGSATLSADDVESRVRFEGIPT